jgi:hypothetical protein
MDNGAMFGGGAGLSDLATNGKLLNQNISLLIQTLKTVFPQVSSIAGGSFTCAASATTTVTETATAANSYIILIPTNAAAGTLMGSTKSLYISARTADTSFAVSTASAASAAGTETFIYLLINL